MGCGKSKTSKPVSGATNTQPAEAGLLAGLADTKPAEAVQEAAASTVTPAADAPELVSVKVEIFCARGLSNADHVGTSEPYVTVELAGRSETRCTTKASTNYKEPKWDHAVEVKGFQTGDSLVFTVEDCDPLKDDILGKATLAADQVLAGFIGELKLAEAGKGVEAFLNVKVEGVDPTVYDQATTVVAEVQEVVAKSLEQTQEAVQDLAEKVEDKVEEAAHDAQVMIEDASKSVCCKC